MESSPARDRGPAPGSCSVPVTPGPRGSLEARGGSDSVLAAGHRACCVVTCCVVTTASSARTMPRVQSRCWLRAWVTAGRRAPSSGGRGDGPGPSAEGALLPRLVTQRFHRGMSPRLSVQFVTFILTEFVNECAFKEMLF